MPENNVIIKTILYVWENDVRCFYEKIKLFLIENTFSHL